MEIKTVILLILILTIGSCKKEESDNNNQPDPPQAEPLAGGSFDEWVEVTQGAVTYENPSGGWWGSLNTLSFIGGPITVTKTEDAYAGAFAARLETKKWGDQLTIPGILASGYFDTALPMGENLVIGQPFDKRPRSFNGYYKYEPAGNDSLVILIALTRFDTEKQKRDTLAQANFVSGLINSNYESFNLVLEYIDEAEPDSIHIILLSSIKGQQMQGCEGSVLKVDELCLKYD